MFDYNLNMMKWSASNMNLRLNSHTASSTKKKIECYKKKHCVRKSIYIYFEEGGGKKKQYSHER